MWRRLFKKIIDIISIPGMLSMHFVHMDLAFIGVLYQEPDGLGVWKVGRSVGALLFFHFTG